MMRTITLGTLTATAAAVVACIFMLPGFVRGAEDAAPPGKNPELLNALSDESLLAAAGKTSDAATLFGLARLASGEAREQIAGRIALVSPDDAPAALALVCAFARELTLAEVERFLEADRENGLPYCLKASLLVKDGKTSDGLAELAKGLAFEKFETYDKPEYRKGVLPALDLLGLSGEARLFALEKAIRRRVRPTGQRIYWSFIELGYALRSPELAMSREQRNEAADLLIKLAGSLMHENGNRLEGSWCGLIVLGSAFGMRADAATDKDVKKAFEVTASFTGGGPQYGELAAQDFCTALAVAGDEPLSYRFNPVFYKNLADGDKARVDEMLSEQQAAAEALIELLAAQPDAIAGVAAVESVKAASERMNTDYPEVAEAVRKVLAAHEAAQDLFTELSDWRQSQRNLMYLGVSLLIYSQEHKDTLPPDLKTIVAEGYLQKGRTIESPVTGRPYVLALPGASVKGLDWANTVMAYDDAELEGGFHIVVYLDGHSSLMPADKLAEALKR